MRWLNVFAAAGLITDCGQRVKREEMMFNCDSLNDGEVY